MAENGILDYQGMNQAIYRGATSNIIVDTQSMSIEIGAGNSSHTSNLHFECNHDANVASIKLNSNVTTEFSRSKKLIKYPRVALTQNDESGTSGYVASANSEYPTENDEYAAFRAFNTKGIGYDYAATIGWESANTPTFNSSGTWIGSTSSSVNTTMTLEEGNTIYGEWLQIQLPTKIRLEYVNFLILKNTSHAMAHRGPRAGYILGSNNGTNWTTLKNWSGIVYDTWTAYYDKFYKFDIDKEVDNYQYFRFVWTETAGTSSLSEYASCQELEFWGVPEYDPEAHGTDVVVKSVPNVPNTDFLDVFVDAGNTSGYSLSGSSVNSVADLSSPANTMSVTGVTYDLTNKAFVFSGSQTSFIKATLLNGNGNYAHTLSVWFMMTDYSGSWRSIMGLGSNATGEQSAIAYNPNQDRLYFGTYGADIYVSHKPELYKWYHVAATFLGGSTTSTSMNIYLNGVNMGGVPDGTQTLSFTGNHLCIGGTMNTNGTVANNPFKGQIANARFYRRAYTSDEIYQLYAYQKEYFGHGDLGMTLKAGRLGIGTSEPRAVLDVRGTLKVNGPATFTGRSNFTESLFFYTGNAPSNYYVSTYKNLHGYYLNTLIPPDSHIGSYGTGGDDQCFTEGAYGSSNELCASHFDSMVYWLKYAPVGHVHRLNWCSKNGSGGSQTYGQKTSDTQIRLWGYWFHTGTYDRDWTSGVYFSISTSTISVSYQGVAFQ